MSRDERTTTSRLGQIAVALAALTALPLVACDKKDDAKDGKKADAPLDMKAGKKKYDAVSGTLAAWDSTTWEDGSEHTQKLFLWNHTTAMDENENEVDALLFKAKTANVTMLVGESLKAKDIAPHAVYNVTFTHRGMKLPLATKVEPAE